MSEDNNCELPNKSENNNIASKIFWGLLLILIGGIALAGNFNLIKVEWGSLWRLWPLFIIVAGLSILSFKNIIWNIISVILAVLTVCAIGWILIGSVNTLGIGYLQTYNETIKIKSEEVKSAVIFLDTEASEIDISTTDQLAVVDANLSSNYATMKQSSSVDGFIQTVNLSMQTDNNWFVGNMQNHWDIKLSRVLPISLMIDYGACDADINLSEAKLNEVNIKGGASNLLLKLGDKQSIADINIDLGVSSVKIQIPKKIGVKLYLDGGLNAKDLTDLKQIDGETYESENYDGFEKKININAKIGVSSFTIERY